jgi:site-specific DNA-methyltransferase (adenine-specific)
MQKLKDEGKQIDSVVTDPPYHLTSIVERYGKEGSAPAKDRDGLYQRQARGFMGKEWDGGDIAFRTDTWKLAYDLLKPGGYLLAFSASRNYHRMAVAIEDAGFEIRDQIMWIYGSGFPKSLNVGDGWGTALKPAHEPIVMARKPLEGTNKQNIEKYGTGGINIDGCRIQGDDIGGERKITNRKPRDENNVWTDENSGMKQEANHFADADPKGRYPANLIHDGLQEEWARYFYCPKTSSAERNRGLDDFDTKKMGMSGGAQSKGDGYDKGQGIGLNRVIERKNTHPTVKPQELMKYLCRLVTPKGGVVLDPFMGSGSTGMAAKDEGFDFIGIEKEQEYFEIAEARIKVSSPLMEFM